MSFEIKYDRDGNVITPAPIVEEVQQPIEQLLQEEVAQPVEEKPEQEEVVVSAPKESEQAKNFRAIREKAERAERERDELMRRLQEIEAKSKQVQPEEEPESSIGDDDLVEGKHLRKYNKEIKALKEQLKSYQQQTAETVIEAKIKSQYADFDSVVNVNNIEMLRTAYPEVAHTLNANPDLYSKAVSAYTLIKKLGIHQDESYKADIARAQKNAVKPRPLASVSPTQGDSPLSKANAFANGLTDDLKKQLYREMLDARRMN